MANYKKVRLPKGITRASNGKFKVSVRLSGIKPIYKTTGSLEDALKIKARILLQIEEGTIRRGYVEAVEHLSWTLREALDATLKLPFPDGWRGSKGISTAILNSEQAIKYFGETKKINDLILNDFDDYRTHCMDELHNSNSTINKKISVIRKLCGVAKSRGGATHIPESPKNLRVSNTRTRCLELEEVQKVHTLMLAAGYALEADMVILSFQLGLRRSEIQSLFIENIDFIHNKIHVEGLDGKGTKNGTVRILPLPRRAKEILEIRISAVEAEPAKRGYQRRSKDKLLYPVHNASLRRAWDFARKRLDMTDDPDFVFHGLRHTFISTMAEKGVTMARLQQLAGHKSMAATMRYIHVAAFGLDDSSAEIMDDLDL